MLLSVHVDYAKLWIPSKHFHSILSVQEFFDRRKKERRRREKKKQKTKTNKNKKPEVSILNIHYVHIHYIIKTYLKHWYVSKALRWAISLFWEIVLNSQTYLKYVLYIIRPFERIQFQISVKRWMAIILDLLHVMLISVTVCRYGKKKDSGARQANSNQFNNSNKSRIT